MAAGVSGVARRVPRGYRRIFGVPTFLGKCGALLCRACVGAGLDFKVVARRCGKVVGLLAGGRTGGLQASRRSAVAKHWLRHGGVSKLGISVQAYRGTSSIAKNAPLTTAHEKGPLTTEASSAPARPIDSGRSRLRHSSDEYIATRQPPGRARTTCIRQRQAANRRCAVLQIDEHERQEAPEHSSEASRSIANVSRPQDEPWRHCQLASH